jgi:hypothetical protein
MLWHVYIVLPTSPLPVIHLAMFTLDPTWLPFSNLMLSHIYNVLLICNDYDRFLLEEDGRAVPRIYAARAEQPAEDQPHLKR